MPHSMQNKARMLVKILGNILDKPNVNGPINITNKKINDAIIAKLAIKIYTDL